MAKNELISFEETPAGKELVQRKNDLDGQRARLAADLEPEMVNRRARENAEALAFGGALPYPEDEDSLRRRLALVHQALNLVDEKLITGRAEHSRAVCQKHVPAYRQLVARLGQAVAEVLRANQALVDFRDTLERAGVGLTAEMSYAAFTACGRAGDDQAMGRIFLRELVEERHLTGKESFLNGL
jgi:hypothetical protein